MAIHQFSDNIALSTRATVQITDSADAASGPRQAATTLAEIVQIQGNAPMTGF